VRAFEDVIRAAGTLHNMDPELVAALEALTPEQREVIALRFVADLALEEVAQITGRRVGAIKALQHRALENLRAIAERLQQRGSDIQLDFDLAELRGYKYQTGMVFAMFVPGNGREIARGGRYDAGLHAAAIQKAHGAGEADGSDPRTGRRSEASVTLAAAPSLAYHLRGRPVQGVA
jgi:ATP phosphoribosyltransferase regulatory subunit HisZ